MLLQLTNDVAPRTFYPYDDYIAFFYLFLFVYKKIQSGLRKIREKRKEEKNVEWKMVYLC